eukprot:scaffold5375_cov110-Isochrysis_galbana.AAC.8
MGEGKESVRTAKGQRIFFLGLGAADLADVVLLFFELARADAHVMPLGHEHGAGGRVVALAALRVVMEHEGFVFSPELAALADDVVDCAKNIFEFEEELARPVEAERRAHHGAASSFVDSRSKLTLLLVSLGMGVM